MVRFMMGNIPLNVFIAPRLVLIPRIYEHGILPSSQWNATVKVLAKILHVKFDEKKDIKFSKKGHSNFVSSVP